MWRCGAMWPAAWQYCGVAYVAVSVNGGEETNDGSYA